MNKITLEAIK